MTQRILLISIALVLFSSMTITEDNTLATEIPKEFSAPDPECNFDKQLLAQSKMLAGTTFMLQGKMEHQPNMELAKEALIKKSVTDTLPIRSRSDLISEMLDRKLG